MHINEILCKHLLHHLYEVHMVECVDHLKKRHVQSILYPQLELQQFGMVLR